MANFIDYIVQEAKEENIKMNKLYEKKEID